MLPTSTKLEEQLLKIRREAEEKDAQQRAAKAGLSYLNLTTAPVQVDALKLIPEEEARRLLVAPFQLKVKNLALAVGDPVSKGLTKLVKRLTEQGYAAKLFVVSQSSLNHVWSFYKFVPKETEEITGKVSIAEKRLDELFQKLATLEKIKQEILSFDFKKFPTGQILEVVLAGALNNRASDIHFEAEERGVVLRYRVDGSLRDVVKDLPHDIYRFVVARIKLLSNLKLNVSDAPQDGRFTIRMKEKDIELRVAISPSEFGEAIVMRVLDPSSIKITLSQLGLRPDDLEIIRQELNRPNGMILNTGPTGSGKTTTLYAFLQSKRTPELKIITIEDPIEYHVEGLEQTQVDSEAGYTFASGLRSMMRQDPDVILVGEVRDKETADIAIQAALTGHLVFSTVHANSAAGAVPRFLDLGVKPVSIGPALKLVIAQRLVRRLCPDCKKPVRVTPELDKKIQRFLGGLPKRVNRDDYEKIQIFEPGTNCEKCGGFGYKGRVAIFELLQIAEDMQSLISPDVGEAAINKEAVKRGMATMQEDGILKVISGISTFEEVEEVTGLIKW